MALTFTEIAKFTQNTLDATVIELFARENPVLERMPFLDINGQAYVFNRETALATTAFRGANDSYTASHGTVTPVTETLKVCGGDIDFDRMLMETARDPNLLRGSHDAIKVKTLSRNWLKTFFDGNDSTDPNEFDGLNVRISGDQVLDAGTGGAELTLTMVDDLIDQVDGDPDVLLVNRKMRRKISNLARAANQATEVVNDAFGRRLEAYAGIPMAVISEDASGTDILAFDEDDGAENEDTCSIYAMKFGLEHMHGIQTGPLAVMDLGQLQEKPSYRTRVEWIASYVVKNPNSAARLRYINDA